MWWNLFGSMREMHSTIVSFGIHSSIYPQQCIIMSLMVREYALLLKMLPEPIKPHVLSLTQRPPHWKHPQFQGLKQWSTLMQLEVKYKITSGTNLRPVELNNKPLKCPKHKVWVAFIMALVKTSQLVSVIFCRWRALESNRSLWVPIQTPPTSCGSIGPETWLRDSHLLSLMAAQRGLGKVKVDHFLST